MSFGERLSRAWYSGQRWPLLFTPLSWVVSAVAQHRRSRFLEQGPRWQPPVPLLVVGNITVGGTGKTPLVQTLVRELRDWGYRPGIISRGYGGQGGHYPLQVTPESDPALCGDEPLLLAQTTGCPVFVDPDRCAAAQALLAHSDIDLIISDDGLQHYRLGRTIEWAVLDSTRGLGNGRLLPAGPLREPATRLESVDQVIINGGEGESPYPNGYRMQLAPQALVNLLTGQRWSPEEITMVLGQAPVLLLAGIGNPQRFFETMAGLGVTGETREFPDHHAYRAADIAYNGPVIMTEKDAVKCRHLAAPNHWYLQVGASLPQELLDQLRQRLSTLRGKTHG
ncbi:tetraacyldisaccharide 4'-kinase [Aestuariirhabdus litorea]|uniref:Tetraacyldisaccharide 4'-kinase n=1 Tax=Aestuariirhabdus litorea TaxID=2528527 RepID=A0A3P3VVA6_9GAMM|nr:tetraacyldisaccharide 4'-kinase [Aestuariirhabdus litorea]RRJ84683.1 tetraacyldisaccharide 4'-kinase [Aestuariirhabdus litorea]RWW97908.1 tetraacyldisaccharide 4'-kinase [Endozoicomonadaceae bacterium GTF-13]